MSRVKRHSIWRLGDIYFWLSALRHRISISCRSIFFFFPLFYARKNAALPIAGRFSLRLWAANWIADSLLSLIIAPHINTHNPFFHKLWCWPQISLFFFRGNTVSHSAAAICYIWSSRYIFLSHPSFSAHETNASANFYCAAWLSLSIKKKIDPQTITHINSRASTCG